MKEMIMSLATNLIYEIEIKRNSENYSVCPECSKNRRKKNIKCFSYNAEKEVGYCNHCEARFVKHVPFEKKNYTKPEMKWENYTKLSEKLVKWFEKRGISQKTLLRMKIGEKEEWLPQIEKKGNCIVFPYFRNGELVNVKYRDGQKNFKLHSGAELIWFNYDALKVYKEIIIVEGEMDALSLIQAGFENVISVPNGASTGRMEYFDNSLEDLNQVETFILATDNDMKGLELKNDLTRRLGIEKCKSVSFKQFKDANELLVAEGADELKKAIENAKFLKLSNVYAVEDFQADLDTYFNNGLPQGLRIGVEGLDERIRWQTGRFGVVTGTPGSGKSEFMDFVYSKLNALHHWGIGYYTPESMPLPSHFARVFSKFIGKEYKKGVISETEKEIGEEYLNKNVFWVAPHEDMTIDDILARFEYLAKAKGCKAFLIDPFNRIEQGANHSDNERLFIKKALGKMIAFTKKTDSLLFLVAHPTKLPKGNDGKFKMPTPYDISGSADFWNMPDYCMSIRRNQDDDGKFLSHGTVLVSKTKINKTLGDTGQWDFWYNINNGRYLTDFNDGAERIWDNSNWITKEEPKEYALPKMEATPSIFEQEDDDDFPF